MTTYKQAMIEYKNQLIAAIKENDVCITRNMELIGIYSELIRSNQRQKKMTQRAFWHPIDLAKEGLDHVRYKQVSLLPARFRFDNLGIQKRLQAMNSKQKFGRWFFGIT